mmetsp:Transcript_27490/g.66875  ORF Transcript_27490/g.66875 Transcript_27490/m.66875 type:complete len:80 (+) Transcript_27490:1390-1629(+)
MSMIMPLSTSLMQRNQPPSNAKQMLISNRPRLSTHSEKNKRYPPFAKDIRSNKSGRFQQCCVKTPWHTVIFCEWIQENC